MRLNGVAIGEPTTQCHRGFDYVRLNHLRAQPRQFIDGLGWVAMMAEHGSSTIDGNQTTVTTV